MPAEPLWKSLVLQLEDQAVESPYLERLRARLDMSVGRRSLEQELVQEMAGALGRTEDKVNVALLRLDVAGQALDRLSPGDAGRAAQVAAFNALRVEAERARWELMVHRDAMGLRRTDLSELYPIPPQREA